MYKRQIHISTDYVYDSRKAAPYVETDEKCPVNVYASTKYAGEVALALIHICEYGS